MISSDTTQLEGRAMWWHGHGAERVAHHVERFCALARGLEPDELAVPVPGMDWNVLDVVAHVATVWRRYTVDPRRAATWAEVASTNADDLAGIDHDLPFLLGEIEQHTATMALAADAVEPDTPLPFHAGQHLTLAGAWGNAIDELLVHGDDIARATGRPWSVEPADMEAFWRYTVEVLAGFLTDRGRAARDRWTLELGFDTGAVRLRFDAGSIHVDESGDWPADHVVVGDAAEIALAMAWRRRPPTTPEMEEFSRRVQAV